MEFKDYYSKQSEEYSKHRPLYPEEIFSFLASLSDHKQLAVDCATGNGQAALGLAKHFKKVIALDASPSQISNCFDCGNVEYRVAKVEDTGLGDNSTDLVTIATALHWVNKDLFYEEVKRILKPGGIMAAWTYGTNSEIEPVVSSIIDKFSDMILDELWDRNIDQIKTFEFQEFPFERIPAPDFIIKKDLTMEQLLNYIYTWSSTQKYIELHNSNPLDILRADLIKVWKPEETKEVRWTIKMLAGKFIPT